MKKLIDKLDRKYLKICTYASCAVIATVIILSVLAYSGGFWETLWTMFTAILKPIIIGFIICYLFLPLINKLERLLSKEKQPWTRPAAVAIFYVGVGIIVALLIILLYYILKGGIDSIRDLNFDAIKDMAMQLYTEFEELFKSLEDQFSTSKLPIGKIGDIIAKLVDGITGFFSGLLFGVIFSIYFMLDENNIRGYWGRVVRVINGDKAYNTMSRLAGEADHVFSGYLRGQLIDAFLVGVMSSVILSIAGIPYAIAIGILMGLGNLIPYVGPVVGYGAVILICLVMGQYDKLILGVILIAIIMFVDGNIINPKLLSDNIEIHPLLVVAALLAGGAIGGIVGMLIAVPTAAFIKLQFEKIIDKKEREDAREKMIDDPDVQEPEEQ